MESPGIVVSPSPATWRVGPTGYHFFAQEFLRVARLANVGGFSPVVCFLYCHAIELGFKAFLKVHGYNDDELRKIGHCLKSARRKARKHGLDSFVVLSDQEKAELTKANAKYSSKGFEYFDSKDFMKRTMRYFRGDDSRGRVWPDLAALDTIAGKIIEAIESQCYKD